MSFTTLLSEAHASGGAPATGDVLSVGLPLLRQLRDLHAEGMVSGMGGLDHVVYSGTALGVDPMVVKRPSRFDEAVFSRNPWAHAAGVVVTGRIATNTWGDGHTEVTNSDVLLDTSTLPDRPMMVVGYRAWEQLLGHHDPLTDIHLAGLLLASYATALDLRAERDIETLATNRRHLLRLNPHLHPVVAGVITDMVEPDRTKRPTDLTGVIARLENHRDIPADLDLDAAYQAAAPDEWRPAVLSHLRERVFDLTRRNRAIYFRSTAATVALTEASVPMMLDVKRIRSADLLTWNEEVAAEFADGIGVNLERWCRFEDSPHVPPALDKLISTERKMRAEFGFGRLKLILAFLRWTDPETNEIVNSPLLFLPAELTRKKGVKPLYRLRTEEVADVNPDLRHLLNVRFGISLPPSVDPSPVSVLALVSELEKKVQTTDPAVRIEVVDKPRIRLIRQRAKLRLDAYRKRKAGAMARTGRWRRQDHSYDSQDWRPLGLTLYRRFVASPTLPLRNLTDAAPRPKRSEFFAAENAEDRATAVRENTVFSTHSDDVNRHRWEVDLCAVTLASIGSKRTTLVRDYDELLSYGEGQATQHALSHGPFDQLFSPEPRQRTSDQVDPIGTDQLLVLPADDAQARAVRRAVRGDSFIIQGPPGTGKSQTITNLIAGLVGEGKRVLFVCEKRAALDVVANRLGQVGLGHLTATIHDSQLDRKPFIRNMADTYEAWMADDSPDPHVERSRILDQMDHDLGRLESMGADLGGVGGGLSIRDLIERISSLRMAGVDPAMGGASLIASVSAGDWVHARPGLDVVAGALSQAGHPLAFSRHGAFMVTPDLLQSEGDPGKGLIERVVGMAEKVAESVDGLAVAGVDLASVSIDDLPLLERDAAALVEMPAAGSAMNPASEEHRSLQESVTRYQELRQAADATADVPGRWSQPLDLLDARTALVVAQQREGSFFSRFNRQWRSIRKAIRSAYDFDAHQIEPPIAQVLTDLIGHLEATRDLHAFEATSLRTWGLADPADVFEVAKAISGGPLTGMVSGPGFDAAAVAPAAKALQSATPVLLHAPNTALVDLASWAASSQRIAPSMERALISWRDLVGASPDALRAASVPGAQLPGIELAILESTLQELNESGLTGGMTGAELEATVDRLMAANSYLMGLNAKSVAFRAEEKFRRHVEVAQQSGAGHEEGSRDQGDKLFKRQYTNGRKTLENEFRKKIRHKSIRELASGDPGLVVQDLTPIWLMSPLSVSETLPLDSELFDAVVFDEASQIPVEDAVPTVFRAPQVIVVGDRMQLPPTRFFAAENDEDGEILVDADGHNLFLSLDADSFLTQSDLTLESALLNWHYRSRFESLIAYSNAAFYDSGLATVPDRVLASGPIPPIDVTSAEQARANAQALLERPISFHHVRNGIYDDRRNESEADYIAELVRSLLTGNSKDTIGVVAFSEAQQGQIESALAELATLDSKFAAALEAEQERTDGDEFVGLFVKNLENVQGDERDIIIMSVCYGPTSDDGRIRMNFGPINQSGGERRLNVIFSRAKRHMAIVSSMVGSDVTNTHNPGAAHLGRFLTYAAAESVGDEQASATALAALAPRGTAAGPRTPLSAVLLDMADALRSQGLEVDAHVGRSGFRVDLAIRGPNAYSLGVMVDPESDADGPIASRFIAEAGVLNAFGWPIQRIMVTDWWKDPGAVIAELVRVARNSAARFGPTTDT